MVDLRNLSKLVYGNGFTIWHYRVDSDWSMRPQDDGYFNDAISLLNAGDKIEVSTNVSGYSLFVLSTTNNEVLVRLWG